MFYIDIFGLIVVLIILEYVLPYRSLTPIPKLLLLLAAMCFASAMILHILDM